MREKIKEKVIASKRALVLEEVSSLFEKEGFVKLKMQDIAKYLGISVGALYNLFNSKEELFLAYVGYQIEHFYDELCKKTYYIKEPKECLRIYVELKWNTFKKKRKTIEDPLMGDPFYLLKMQKRQFALIEPIYRKLAGWFEELGIEKEQDSMKLALLFHAFTNGYVEYWVATQKEFDEPKRVVELFLKGVM